MLMLVMSHIHVPNELLNNFGGLTIVGNSNYYRCLRNT
jgi:hypothetical protein